MYAHSARQHIPQPPHSAGEAIKGFRTAIDPTQIPSPVESTENDRVRWERQHFTTLPGQRVPLSTTDFFAIDQGNASPKFIRATTWNVPSSSRLSRECAIPIAAIVQPLARLDQYGREEPIPLVDTGEFGPERCAGCRGYINPWCIWVGGGSRWKCNLCGHETEVAPHYFSNLDGSGLRLDHLQRPELNKGVVDFAVPDAYWASHPLPRLSPSYYSIEPPPASGTRAPAPMDYVFLIEKTLEGVNSGFLRAACDALLEVLYGSTGDDGTVTKTPCIPPSSKVAIITFDGNINFHDLSANLSMPHMLVVSDLDEVFVPLREGLFVDPQESRALIESLLHSLPTPTLASTQNCLGSALRGALATLAGRGGHIILFGSTLANIGPDALAPRMEEASFYDTDKERTLVNPHDTRWATLGEECAEQGVGVSSFLAPGAFMDVGSIAAVVNASGGELAFHPRFDIARDGHVLNSQLRRLLGRPTVYNCLLRTRCSSSLRVKEHYGNFSLRSDTGDLAFGIVHADTAFSVELAHTGKLDTREYAHIQCALLYTTVDGLRRVRVCNVALQVADLAGNVFKFADMDAVVTHFAKEGMTKLSSVKSAVVKEELTEKCAALLLGYRKNCAISTPASQLILPDVFQALPAFVLGILKTKPLKGRTVTSDVRNYHIHKLLASSARSTMEHVYPRLLAVHDLDDSIALPDPTTGSIEMPSCMRSSHLFMEAHGIYIIDNEEMTIFWVGLGSSPQQLQDLFGVDDIIALTPHLTRLPVLDTRLSAQVRNILADRTTHLGGRETRVMLARQNMDGAEIEFADLLVEDQNNGAMSYVDYLCQIHKQIHTVLTEGGSIGGSSVLRGTPW